MTRPQLFGRNGSHFTRLVRMVAFEAGVDLDFQVIGDIQGLDPADYGGHPGLKFPVLVRGEERTFGALTICRRIVEAAPRECRILWPEAMDPALQNAWELLSHAMLAQVQLVFGIAITGLPADHAYIVKAERGLDGTMAWLNARLPQLLAARPADQLSLFEIALYCQWEHLRFRPTVTLDGHDNLAAFSEAFGARPSALATPYLIDRRP